MPCIQAGGRSIPGSPWAVARAAVIRRRRGRIWMLYGKVEEDREGEYMTVYLF